MTGAEHSAEAERLLACEARDDAHELMLATAAQAHATLAVYAALAAANRAAKAGCEHWGLQR